MADGTSGAPRLLRALKVSWKGLGWAFRHEEAFRLEALAACLLVPAALWLGHSGVERAVLVMSVGLVLVAELLNSAVEAAIDRIGRDWHELSGAAKDLGSAAVHIALLQVPLVWGLVLLG